MTRRKNYRTLNLSSLTLLLLCWCSRLYTHSTNCSQFTRPFRPLIYGRPREDTEEMEVRERECVMKQHKEKKMNALCLKYMMMIMMCNSWESESGRERKAVDDESKKIIEPYRIQISFHSIFLLSLSPIVIQKSARDFIIQIQMLKYFFC